jgi:hypothetical protein
VFSKCPWRPLNHFDHGRWAFDDQLHVLTVPTNQDETLLDARLTKKRNKTERIRVFGCEYENASFPQSLDFFMQNNTV